MNNIDLKPVIYGEILSMDTRDDYWLLIEKYSEAKYQTAGKIVLDNLTPEEEEAYSNLQDPEIRPSVCLREALQQSGRDDYDTYILISFLEACEYFVDNVNHDFGLEGDTHRLKRQLKLVGA